jgi:DNA-binding GntR family transcriptional regulator
VNIINTEEGFLTAAEKAYNTISKNILLGRLEPGCKLSRRKMAKLAGVSVIPVIEALKRLEQDGLVESKPQIGSFVIVPTLKNVKQVYVLREAIECQVARILTEKLSNEQEQELRRISVEIDSIDNTKEYISERHYEFHLKMAQFTGYNSLVTSLHKINLFWVLCKAVLARRDRSPVPEDWHMRLVDAIVSGNKDKAENMMRIHVYDSLKTFEYAGDENVF